MNVILFGRISMAGGEPRQRFYCNACEKSFVPELDAATLRLRPLQRLGKEVLRGMAMYAHGLSLKEVEIQAEVQMETVKSNLISLERQGLGDDLEERILTDYPMVSKTSMDDLRETVRKSAERKNSFQSRSAKLRREAEEKTARQREEFWSEIEEISMT